MRESFTVTNIRWNIKAGKRPLNTLFLRPTHIAKKSGTIIHPSKLAIEIQ